MDAQKQIAETPQVEVKPNVTRGGRTTYHAECVDPSAFIGEFIERMQRGDRSMVRFI